MLVLKYLILKFKSQRDFRWVENKYWYSNLIISLYRKGIEMSIQVVRHKTTTFAIDNHDHECRFSRLQCKHLQHVNPIHSTSKLKCLLSY